MIVILLIGCQKQDFKVDAPLVFKGHAEDLNKITEEMIRDLQAYPQVIKIEDYKDICFIVAHGQVKSDIKLIEDFFETSSKGQHASLTLIQYTTEGDPILTQVTYDGKYFSVEDNSRDKFGQTRYFVSEFEVMKRFNEEGRIMYYLFNDPDINYDQLMKSLLSSHSKDKIPNTFLISYQVD